MQINETPTTGPSCAGGSSSWQTESVLLGGPTPTPAPRSQPKAMTVLEIPSFGKKSQKWLSFITHPWSFLMSPSQNSTWRSSCHIRRRKFPLSHQLIPAQAIFRLLLLVLGLSSQSCSRRIRAALWAPGGIAVGARQQQGDSIPSTWESPGSEINRTEREELC